MISFKLKKATQILIERVASRAKDCGEVMNMDLDAKTIQMDLTACHKYGCKLDLEKMLMTRGVDLLHDVMGINRHLDRDTGNLTNNFHPRCAA